MVSFRLHTSRMEFITHMRQVARSGISCVVCDHAPILPPQHQGVVCLDLYDVQDDGARAAVECIASSTLEIHKVTNTVLLRLGPIGPAPNVRVPQSIPGLSP